MPKVCVLPADVIAKIAAGEVVDRPASVVKELMENSLDAGAGKVEVNLTAGGKTLIQVRDNGGGIDREDLDNLFARHATSKIRTGDDLDSILSLGFRGEALYSVASVAELTLKTRSQKAKEAWEIKVAGGRREAPVPAALPAHGTDIRVEEIFFNTPARKKFLKSDSAEFDQVVNVFLPYALLYPDKHFVLSNNGRVIYDLPPADAAARCAKALALEARHMVAFSGEKPEGYALSGLLGDMNIQRPRRDLQFLFVNGRPVHAKGLLFHMNDVFRLVMPEGAHPFFVLKLTLPPAEVDVNIHPGKREVRIKDEAELGRLIRRTVEQALMTGGGAKVVKEDIFSFPSGLGVLEEGVPADRMVFAPAQHPRPAEPTCAFRPARPVLPEPEQDFMSFAGQLAAQREESVKDRLARARLIGTFNQKYHLFEEGESLFAVDQHAAQERVMFELFTRKLNEKALEVERWLTPVMVRLSPREMLAWERARELLAELGFESSLAADDAVALQAAPRLVKSPEKVFRVLLGEEAKEIPSRDMLARRACRASVMSGDWMHAHQAKEQLKALLDCQDPFTCPHGRPVFIELKTSFLDKQFMRV